MSETKLFVIKQYSATTLTNKQKKQQTQSKFCQHREFGIWTVISRFMY